MNITNLIKEFNKEVVNCTSEEEVKFLKTAIIFKGVGNPLDIVNNPEKSEKEITKACTALKLDIEDFLNISIEMVREMSEGVKGVEHKWDHHLDAASFFLRVVDSLDKRLVETTYSGDEDIIKTIMSICFTVQEGLTGFDNEETKNLRFKFFNEITNMFSNAEDKFIIRTDHVRSAVIGFLVNENLSEGDDPENIIKKIAVDYPELEIDAHQIRIQKIMDGSASPFRNEIQTSTPFVQEEEEEFSLADRLADKYL